MLLLKKHTHDQRVQLGGMICDRILEAYKNDVLAVFIVGSTAKNLDRPYSDLEMIAVVKNGFAISTKSYVHDGLIVGIEYVGESKLLEDARLITREWPFAADQYRNRIVLFEKDGWFAKLDRAVKDLVKTSMDEAVVFSMIGLFESLGVILNSIASSDEPAVRSAGVYLSWDAGKLVLLLNQKYLLTTTRFWKEVVACPLKPENFWTLAEKLAGFTHVSVHEIGGSAELLCDAMLKIVEQKGLSIESSKLII